MSQCYLRCTSEFTHSSNWAFICVGIKPGLSLAFSTIMGYSTPSRKLRGPINWAQEQEGSRVANLAKVSGIFGGNYTNMNFQLPVSKTYAHNYK